MIFFWNRREVYFGSSFEKFNKTREALSTHKIEYSYKIDNQGGSYTFGSRQSNMGTFGENLNNSKMYTLFVHKHDYDEAIAAIHRI